MPTCLGCNLYPGDIKNIGPPTLNSYIEKFKNENVYVNKFIEDCMSKKLNMSLDVINMCVQSIMYEPANELTLQQSSVVEKYVYLMQEPRQISNYLEE